MLLGTWEVGTSALSRSSSQARMGFSAIQLLKAFTEWLLNTRQRCYQHCAVLQGQREHPHGTARAGVARCHRSRPMGSVPGVCRRGLAEVRGVTGTAGAMGTQHEGTLLGTPRMGHGTWGHPTWSTLCGAPCMGHPAWDTAQRGTLHGAPRTGHSTGGTSHRTEHTGHPTGGTAQGEPRMGCATWGT